MPLLPGWPDRLLQGVGRRSIQKRARAAGARRTCVRWGGLGHTPNGLDWGTRSGGSAGSGAGVAAGSVVDSGKSNSVILAGLNKLDKPKVGFEREQAEPALENCLAV